MIRFTVPGKPLGKGRPRFSRQGGGSVFTPAKTVSYESTLALFASQAMSGAPPFAAGIPLRCSIVAYFDVPASWSKRKRASAYDGITWPTGKPDGDNLAKIVGDALNGIVWQDDSQIVEWTVTKRYNVAAGMAIAVDAVAVTHPLR